MHFHPRQDTHDASNGAMGVVGPELHWTFHFMGMLSHLPQYSSKLERTTRYRLNPPSTRARKGCELYRVTLELNLYFSAISRRQIFAHLTSPSRWTDMCAGLRRWSKQDKVLLGRAIVSISSTCRRLSSHGHLFHLMLNKITNFTAIPCIQAHLLLIVKSMHLFTF